MPWAWAMLAQLSPVLTKRRIPCGTYVLGTAFTGFSSEGMTFSNRGSRIALATAPNEVAHLPGAACVPNGGRSSPRCGVLAWTQRSSTRPGGSLLSPHRRELRVVERTKPARADVAAHVHGVILLAAAQNEVPVVHYRFDGQEADHRARAGHQ